ncbi:MmgE/PrpD family protein [Bradyrhizobium sp. 137]|uniref:MmgE/PrpD family protein n=1 Tax=Bradyrhizobium sp. 137 TaxID=2782614 RepID=UPI001FFA6711|nr:MmgE/PrpD family protein [Bradyrhizobium sp. 137]MCK1757014.1 MmgE/PrpD family protein [Bradyrhizobium sp. 137]
MCAVRQNGADFRRFSFLFSAFAAWTSPILSALLINQLSERQSGALLLEQGYPLVLHREKFMQTGKSDLTTAFAEVLQGVATTELAADTVQAAKQRILDMLSVTFDGLEEPASAVAFRSVGPSDGLCTVIGCSATAAAADAAFVNAVTSHTTGQADCGGGGHPGTFVVPVSLSLGEQHRRSGKEVLSAIVVGYEATQRMHMAAAAGLHSNGFRAVPAIGVFGAAAAASFLSGLDTRQFANALNFAANMAGGFYEGFGHGTIEGHVHAGLAARAGITAAALAGAGGETSPATLDGAAGFFSTFARDRDYEPGALTAQTAGLGIHSAWSKPFPACKANQETMRLIRSLQPAGFAPSEIERVIVTRPARDYDAPGIRAEPPYHNTVQVLMSAKFTSIATLLGKPVTEFRYFKESFGDPNVEAVARKTTLLTTDAGDETVTVEVVRTDGQTLTLCSADVAHLTWDTDLEARFQRLASPRLHGTARSVLDVVAGLESARDIRKLMQLVRA